VCIKNDCVLQSNEIKTGEKETEKSKQATISKNNAVPRYIETAFI
jgi:hypothetical protein